MRTYSLCLAGFGNVARSLVQVLRAKSDELAERYSIGWRVTGVGTHRLGWLADRQGLDLDALLAGHEQAASVGRQPSVAEWLAAAQADVLFELSSLDPHSGQPAIEHIGTALAAGVHAARAAGRPYRLVAHAERMEYGIRASVRPEQLSPTDPLAGVRGTALAAHFELDLLSGLTLISHNPGPDTTAYDAMADFISVVRKR